MTCLSVIPSSMANSFLSSRLRKDCWQNRVSSEVSCLRENTVLLGATLLAFLLPVGGLGGGLWRVESGVLSDNPSESREGGERERSLGTASGRSRGHNGEFTSTIRTLVSCFLACLKTTLYNKKNVVHFGSRGFRQRE